MNVSTFLSTQSFFYLDYGFWTVRGHTLNIYFFRNPNWNCGWTRPCCISIYCVFVHSCVWSSTSSRRKSDGWGSSSTRGTFASNSWSWRLRTSKTPSLRAHFKTCLAMESPPPPNGTHALLYKRANHVFIPPSLSSYSPDSPLFFLWAPHTHYTGGGFKTSITSTLCFHTVISSILHKVHIFFVHVHTLKHWFLPTV